MTLIGFSLLVLLPNWVYIVNVINDPFGWGWSVLGMDALKWNSVMTGAIPLVIIVMILIGFWISMKMMNRISKDMFPVSRTDYRKSVQIQTLSLLIFTIGLIYAFGG